MKDGTETSDEAFLLTEDFKAEEFFKLAFTHKYDFDAQIKVSFTDHFSKVQLRDAGWMEEEEEMGSSQVW